MARISKYSTGIIGVIKHNIREFKDGKCPTNLEVDPKKSKNNYSIIRRGETAKDIERYRKNIDKECFQYHRKNLVHCIETIFTLPKDCPQEEERRFFEESLRFLCSTLPMGERCIFLAEVHTDEGKISKNGKIVATGANHMHVMYVPAVVDGKHDGFNYRLCADELTKRALLKTFHPKYQKWIDDAGIHATVASGVTSGKGISVKAMKEISKATGLSLEKIKTLEKENTLLVGQLVEKERELAAKNQELLITEKELKVSQSEIESLKNENVALKKEQEKIHTKEIEEEIIF